MQPASGITELQQTLGVPYLFEFRGRTSYGGGLPSTPTHRRSSCRSHEALLTFSGATLAALSRSRTSIADAQIGVGQLASPTGTFAVSGL